MRPRIQRGRFRQAVAVAACLGMSGWLSGMPHALAQAVNSQIASEVVDCGDSAYQLVRATTNSGKSGVRWYEAKSEARRFTHEGRRGRLAVIPNLQVHACVSENLMSKARQEAWIGLRYWCPYQKLQWSTGEFRSHGEPSPWAVKWSRYGTCQSRYAGVYYTRDTKRWQAVERKKRFRYMIVEYPPDSDDKQKEDTQ